MYEAYSKEGGCCTHRLEHSLPISITRRNFIAACGFVIGSISANSIINQLLAQEYQLQEIKPIRKPLLIQPVLAYETPKRREATSWRNWGGIETDEQAQKEKIKIENELQALKSQIDFPIEFLPLELCKTPEQAKKIAAGNHDGILDFAAGAWVQVHEILCDPQKWNIMFVRHKSGPVYLWYEIAHNRFLRKTVDEFGQPGMDIDDVVVDEYSELLWRYRALAALKNTIGKRIVAIGGASGWGIGGEAAPGHARSTWKMEIITVSYDELGNMLKEAYANQSLVRNCEEAAKKYLTDPSVKLQTTQDFVTRAFVLNEVFKVLLKQTQTDTITINLCMGTIMQVSRTTACLPLSLLNDAGLMAFCESDFVVIPAGILLHYISNKPVFLNDPTYPHNGIVTLAHCTAPRRLDGKNLEPAIIMTHFESDYGAAPKVEMKVGQTITNIIPDFSNKRWSGFKGTIIDNPFMAICRSQIDVQMEADTEKVLHEMKGFHWITCYGDWLRETQYALKKLGIQFINLTKAS